MRAMFTFSLIWWEGEINGSRKMEMQYYFNLMIS